MSKDSNIRFMCVVCARTFLQIIHKLAVMPGTPGEIIDHGILECKLKAERKGLTLASSLSKYVKRTRAEPSRGGATSTAQWGSDKHSLSKTLPGLQKHEPNVMTFDSRPPTASAEGM